MNLGWVWLGKVNAFFPFQGIQDTPGRTALEAPEAYPHTTVIGSSFLVCFSPPFGEGIQRYPELVPSAKGRTTPHHQED